MPSFRHQTASWYNQGDEPSCFSAVLSLAVKCQDGLCAVTKKCGGMDISKIGSVERGNSCLFVVSSENVAFLYFRCLSHFIPFLCSSVGKNI